MNKKTFSDIKINTKRTEVKVPSPVVLEKEDKIFNNETELIFKHDLNRKKSDDHLSRYSSKYDFLKKENNFKNNQRISITPTEKNKKSNLNRTILFIFIISILAGIVYAYSTFFLSAKVSLIHKEKDFDLENYKITTIKSGTSGVTFELMRVSDVFTKEVFLSNIKDSNDKAVGKITLYNEYSLNTQKISKGMHLIDENGKDYIVNETVTIPGYKKENNKVIPGEVIVPISSFLPGEIYNGSPEIFKIDLFKNSKDKYNKVYGKILSPLVGGSVGVVYVLDEEEKNNISLSLENFKIKLINKLNAQIPNDYILYNDATFIDYNFEDNIVSKTSNIKIEINGTISAFIIKKSQLSISIIKKLIPGIDENQISIIAPIDLSKLIFKFTDENQLINKEIEKFDFSLSGKIKLNWQPNIEEIKQSINGKNIIETPNIFKENISIQSATVKVSPFWATRLPINLEKIDIMVK